MKTTLIATVLNEESSIDNFLQSILLQTRQPDEIIIVDGGSTDATASVISNFKFQISNKQIKFKLLVRKGNRAVGRNEAIKNAKGQIILCSDAGCILDDKWAEQIIKPFKNKKVDVVTGYYKGKPKSIFEKCLIPYTLVMPDRVSKNTFLPASRSMAFRKSIWKKVGGFDEKYSHNEDYVFAKKLKKIKAKIVFQKNAIINWIPRKNLLDSFKMFFRFAFGDAESRIYRPKVLLIFARYLIFPYLLFLGLSYKSIILFCMVFVLPFAYILWSILKNYKYVKNKQALYFLPIIQITSDLAIISGTIFGFVKKISIKSLFRFARKYKWVSIVIIFYAFAMLSVLNWGIPNPAHPFPYHMDEWHQLQAVRAMFKYGSPNVEGAAHGSVFQFFLSGIYLVPFVLFGFINPFEIKSSVSFLNIQQNLFHILRLNTLIFGVLSIILIAFIGKKYFNISPFLTSFLFAINPLMISLGNYFKYDIALLFWIVLSLKFLMDYGKNQDFKKYMYAAVACALALSVKISALPILPIYIFAYILFTKNLFKKIHVLFFGLSVFLIIFIFFGIPDVIFGKGSITEYLYSNLVVTPQQTTNFVLGMHYLIFLFSRNFPSSFGHLFFYSFIFIALVAFIKSFLILYRYLKSGFGNLYVYFFKLPVENKHKIFFYFCLAIFYISFIPLKFDSRGNRLLVLLPFMVIILGQFINNFLNSYKDLRKIILTLIVLISMLFQTLETLAWLSVKLRPDPRLISSVWIQKNILKDSTIGIENIPIYQSLPDFILKEYYSKEYDNSIATKYNYKVIDFKTSNLPNLVIVTNDEVSHRYLKSSPKKLLLNRLAKEGYKRIFVIRPDFSYFKIIGNELDFFYSQLPASPNSISVFEKYQ